MGLEVVSCLNFKYLHPKAKLQLIIELFHFYRRPIKAALAATAEHLAGLLPLHLVYSQAHETAIEVCKIC